jgi:hypothetical protein
MGGYECACDTGYKPNPARTSCQGMHWQNRMSSSRLEATAAKKKHAQILAIRPVLSPFLQLMTHEQRNTARHWKHKTRYIIVFAFSFFQQSFTSSKLKQIL